MGHRVAAVLADLSLTGCQYLRPRSVVIDHPLLMIVCGLVVSVGIPWCYLQGWGMADSPASTGAQRRRDRQLYRAGCTVVVVVAMGLFLVLLFTGVRNLPR